MRPLRTHFGRAILTFFARLAVGCLRKQPTGGEENRRLKVLEKVLGEDSESTVNCALLSSFAVTSRRSRDVRINQRIDSLPCPALFSMFPGRLARFRGRGFAKLQRSACAGSNYGWIMRQGGGERPEAKWDVAECGWD